mmetsp:Transcript_9534/g.21888  ORF Transcript_9534/g.21888 Transcript_9534/m.21888 type:complete len:378 (+) Transcript_9534:2553-3686(+)
MLQSATMGASLGPTEMEAAATRAKCGAEVLSSAVALTMTSEWAPMGMFWGRVALRVMPSVASLNAPSTTRLVSEVTHTGEASSSALRPLRGVEAPTTAPAYGMEVPPGVRAGGPQVCGKYVGPDATSANPSERGTLSRPVCPGTTSDTLKSPATSAPTAHAHSAEDAPESVWRCTHTRAAAPTRPAKSTRADTLMARVGTLVMNTVTSSRGAVVSPCSAEPTWGTGAASATAAARAAAVTVGPPWARCSSMATASSAEASVRLSEAAASQGPSLTAPVTVTATDRLEARAGKEESKTQSGREATATAKSASVTVSPSWPTCHCHDATLLLKDIHPSVAVAVTGTSSGSAAPPESVRLAVPAIENTGVPVESSTEMTP